MEKFFKYIDNPVEIIHDPNKILLSEITNDFPYFQSAHLLMVIAQHQTDGIFFSDRDLKNAAIYSGDRAKLYDYLVGQTKQIVSEIKHQSKSSVEQPKDIISDSTQINVDLVSNKKSKKEPVEKTQTEALIDKFIRDNPSLQSPREEFYSASKMAMKSITDDESFISETLAQIHVRSKSFEKAIEIYQKLSLIYPEKSNYFAEIIKGLKTKLNE